MIPKLLSDDLSCPSPSLHVSLSVFYLVGDRASPAQCILAVTLGSWIICCPFFAPLLNPAFALLPAPLLCLIQHSSLSLLDFHRQEMIGEESLDHLLGLRPTDIQTLITQIELRLNDNLSMSKREKVDFSLEIPGSSAPSQTISLLLLPPAPEVHEIKTTKSQRQIRSAGRKRGKYEAAGPMVWIPKRKAS